MINRIGIIGFGNMGSAIGEKLKSRFQVWAYDKDSEKIQGVSRIYTTESILHLLNNVDTLILAVKPQDFPCVLDSIKLYVKTKFVISIAAGINTKYIEQRLGNARIVRTMPNMPVKIGQGMICLCRGRFATLEDLDASARLFQYLGKTLVIKEEMMNAATAVSGSGPGFYFDRVEAEFTAYKNDPDKFLKDFIEALSSAAQTLGFSQEEAGLLAATTGNACNNMLVKVKLAPSELKKQVVSKGGTTEAGLEVLHQGGSLAEAVQAAAKRAEELSKN